MKRFVVSICLLALALGDVFATKPSGEFLVGDATPMDTDIKRSGMNEMNKFLSMGMMKTEMKACKDKISSKQCKKLKKKGKCEDKKTWKKCMFTCKKCPGMCEPADLNACSDHGICTEEGFCKCDVGYYGDYCMFPEICDDEPGLLRDGDKIHLLNQYGIKSYLDTCSLSTCPSGGVYDLQTSTSPNRDIGSGTWEIRSVNGTGGPIRYGDKIHLINQYGTKSYLDTCVDETIEGCKGKYSLQTSLSPDRDSGSGTWEISSEKCIGGPVRNGDKIHLINQYKKKSYLDTCSESTLEGCNGTYHLQTSKNPNRDTGSGTWEIEIIFQGNEDFARFDKDADGLISLSEWIEKSALAMNYTMISSMVGREMNETTYNEIFNETDCDDDGNITPKELKMATEQLGYNCCGGICCPWCGTVIKTIVSALQGRPACTFASDTITTVVKIKHFCLTCSTAPAAIAYSKLRNVYCHTTHKCDETTTNTVFASILEPTNLTLMFYRPNQCVAKRVIIPAWKCSNIPTSTINNGTPYCEKLTRCQPVFDLDTGHFDYNLNNCDV